MLAASEMLLCCAWLLLLLSLALTSGGCPASCYCGERGEYVSCVGDGVRRLPDGLPADAVRVELRNFATGALSGPDLSGLGSLRELKLQQSRVESLDNGTFASNPGLERLDLSQNGLARLEAAALADLVRLRHLDLSSNALDSVEGAFVELSGLEQLNLRDNRLSQLTTRTFAGLRSVQYLNLDANNISAIEVGTFQYLANLAHLIVSNNPLATLSRLDFFGSRLQYIDVSRVGLDRVPQSLTKFVRDLRLSRNNLSRIGAGDFDSYPYLGLLVLDDNCLGDIENDALGRLEYLSRLWLNGNCLRRVPPNLPPSLLALYMEENRLTGLPAYSFRGLTRLEQLFLQRNQIRDVQACAFCDLVSLRSLDLQANRIEALEDGAFANLTLLQTLDLSQNGLTQLNGGCFAGLPALATLQLSRVHSAVRLHEAAFDELRGLRTFEAYDSPALVRLILNSTRTLHGLRGLRELNLMHNGVSRLRADFPSFFPSLRVVKLSGNAWHCDRGARWLAHWIKQSSVQFYSSYNIRCASPPPLQLKPLMMLTEGDFAVDGVATPEVAKRVATASTVVVYLNNPPPASVAPPPRSLQSTLQSQVVAVTDARSTTTSSTEGDGSSTQAEQFRSSDVTAFARVGGGGDRPREERLAGVAGALAGGCCLLGLAALAACRLRRPYEPVSQRRSSISYRPQKDEVSIVTLSEHGRNNKLYYIMENDSQLQELLSSDNGQLY